MAAELISSEKIMAAEPKTTATVGDDDDLLPREIWREILIRVPVKSMLRCRSVCKSWYSLISCPSFNSDYSARTLNKNGHRLLLQLYDSGPEVCSYSSYIESAMECREHDDVPESFLGGDVEIVGSCNGLICLSKCCPMKDDVNVSIITFLIWNPTIKKKIELPSRTYCSRTEIPSYFGFGYDDETDDYKVLCIVAYLGENGDVYYDKITNVCEVFDLKKGAWRAISPIIDPSFDIGYHQPKCYLNGVVHWDTYNLIQVKSRYEKIIVSFNMTDELFRAIRFPSAVEFAGYVQTQCVSFDGMIYLICRSDHIINESNNCSVWAMKEYGVTESWTKVFNINLSIAKGLPNTGICLDCFHLWSIDEVFMVHDHSEFGDEESKIEQDLVLYNIKSRTLKHLSTTTKFVYDPCFYGESLALM